MRNRSHEKPHPRDAPMTATPPSFVGRVLHFYARLGVAVVELAADLHVGDVVAVETAVGGGGKLIGIRPLTITSMQIEHRQLASAGAGDIVAILVGFRVRENDRIVRLPEPPMETAS